MQNPDIELLVTLDEVVKLLIQVEIYCFCFTLLVILVLLIALIQSLPIPFGLPLLDWLSFGPLLDLSKGDIGGRG